MSEHNGGLIGPDVRVVPITLAASVARVGSPGHQAGGPTGEVPAEFKPPAVTPAYQRKGDDWLPAWFREHVEKGSPAHAVIDELLARTMKDPHHETLLETAALVNELGRHPAHGEQLRDAVATVAQQLLGKDED